MLLLVVSCTVPHRSNPVSEGPLVLPRSMVNKSAQPCAGRENRHEIPLFTLTLDGERDITRSSTISFAPQELAAKWCAFAKHSVRSYQHAFAKLHRLRGVLDTSH